MSQEAHDSAGPRTQVRGPVLLTVVAFAGAATMVIELGAVRLLAPWFGTSSSVWTNVIGVVLAALALGYALGARLASGRQPLRTLGLVLLVGAAFAAWLPIAATGVASWFMPRGVALHDAADLLVWGSLAAALLLFLPAATALGCAGPLAVETLQRMRGGPAGAAGGKVLACSTLGSLAGTFGTTHVFIPNLGVTATFLGAAGVLAACAALLLVRARGAVSPAAGACAFVLLVGLLNSGAFADVREAREGERLLATVDSSLQSIRVIESGEGEDTMRFLRVNESLDSFQSVWQKAPGLLPPGHYYNQFALPYAWTTRERGTPPESWSVLVLGLGAGTAVRVLDGIVDERTELRTVGVEIDGAVLQVAREHFELKDDGEQHIAVGDLDGRAALSMLDSTFDQIIVDAYANNMEIPAHLASVEAFAEIGSRLREGGWLTINVGGFAADDPVVQAVAAAAAVGMGEEVHIARVPFSRNQTLFARSGTPDVPRPGGRAFGSRGEPLLGDVQSLVAPLEVDGAWHVLTPDEARGAARSDNRVAMERLQVASITGAAQRVERWNEVPASERDAAGSGIEAAEPSDADWQLVQASRNLVASGDLRGALEAAREVEQTALRALQTGTILWSAGDLFGALETVVDELRSAPNDPALLRLAIDLGLVVGAGEAAAERLARLRGIVEADAVRAAPRWNEDERAWWSNSVASLAGLSEDAEARVAARRAAVGRARLAVFLALAAGAVLALVVTLGLGRVSA